MSTLKTPRRLLVHSCCAPCCTVPLERLKDEYRMRVFFYGPNIHPREEYIRRLDAQRRLCDRVGVELVEGAYAPERWEQAVGPFEGQPESSHLPRCQACYRMRMQQTAEQARSDGFDCFTTTLSVSRHKDSKVLAEIGALVGRDAGVTYLDVDFKKGGGFELSVHRSRELDLYRQDYCGCRWSLQESRQRREQRRKREMST
ncbi:MAG: epoxyqueuosine reductase QueH [Deltaproteobacteria bacterium]|nr:epoxyqueuosine reductase QueH [Deltaproteobacteria bacterium]